MRFKTRSAKLIGKIMSKEAPDIDVLFNNQLVYSGTLTSTEQILIEPDIVELAKWDFDSSMYDSIKVQINVKRGAFEFVDIYMNYIRIPEFDITLDPEVKWPKRAPISVEELKYDFFYFGNRDFYSYYGVEKENVKDYANVHSITLFPDFFGRPSKEPIDKKSDGKDNVFIDGTPCPRTILDPSHANGPWHYLLESNQIFVCDLIVDHPYFDLTFYD
jgi:hypothetical protein